MPALLVLVAFSFQCCNDKPKASQGGEETAASGEEATASSDTLENYFKEARLRYETTCSGCHGEQMQAFVDRKWKYGNSEEELFKSIKLGHPENGMPAFGQTLSDEEINMMVSYIKSGLDKVGEYDFAEDEKLAEVFETEEFSFRIDTVVSGLQVPWGMAFLPNEGMLITDRIGKLYRFNEAEKLQEIEGAPKVLAQGQGGMLDVILDPEFESNKVIYLSYSDFKRSGEDTVSTTSIMRATLEGNRLTNQKKIFEALPYSKKRHHYGSRMQFGEDGNLYFSVGDRGNRDENPQDLSRHPGKIHRIKPDGSIPSDNPFVNQEGADPTIYSYGHRNPQGLAFHPETGVLWEHEHGPRGGDEINIIQEAKNYGWPIISYGINYDGTTFTQKTENEGMEQPLLYWVPSIAPSGMTFVTGDRYKGWKGDLLVGSMRYKYLNRCDINGEKVDSEEKLMKNIGRVRDVQMSPDDYIYIAVEKPGIIYKVIPL